MIQKVFTVFDAKAKAYLQPFFMPTTGMATRAFTDLCNDQNHMFNHHPEDYSLFEIAEYDDQTARYTENSTFVPLGTGLEYKTQIEIPETQLSLVQEQAS